MLVFRLGNSEAFTELFRRYRNPVYGFFRRRLENPARAEELAQETFVAVLRGIERHEPRATFRTYLYGIAMKILMAERRRSARRESSAATAVDPSEGSCVEEAIWVQRAIEQLDAITATSCSCASMNNLRMTRLPCSCACPSIPFARDFFVLGQLLGPFCFPSGQK